MKREPKVARRTGRQTHRAASASPELTLATVMQALSENRFELRTTAGQRIIAQCPQHIDETWLAAALAIGPVEALCWTAAGRYVLIGVLPSLEHDAVSVPVKLRGESVTIEGAKSVQLASGKSSVSLAEDGKVEVRGRDVLTRGSEYNRVRGGRVKLN